MAGLGFSKQGRNASRVMSKWLQLHSSRILRGEREATRSDSRVFQGYIFREPGAGGVALSREGPWKYILLYKLPYC
jgi:hypothetical protein